MGTDNLSFEFDKRVEQRRIKRSFALYNVGVFCCWAAYGAIFNLQPSINVENGLGTTTFAVSYIIQAVLSVTLAPILLRKFGAKRCYVVGDAAVILLILSNIYPTYYTLLPAAILMFILQCTAWPSMAMLNVLYAKLYASVSKQSIEHQTIAFSGYFFTAYHCSQVFGNFMSYVLLYGFDPIAVPVDYSPSNCTKSNATSCYSKAMEDYQYCGINDCQNATIIEETIDKYKPLNKSSFYILLAVAAVLVIIATSIQAFLVPNDTEFRKKTLRFEKRMHHHAEVDELETGNGPPAPKTQIHSVTFMLSTMKALFSHCFQLKFIFLLPISLYTSMELSFVYAELTRSLSSCILGFQWVGICMAAYGLFDAIFSWIVGRFGRKISRVLLVLICCAVDCGNYIYVLLWSPNPNLLLSILAMFSTFGIADGMLRTIVNVLHIDLFPKNQDIVVISWNTLAIIGFVIGLGSSRFLCVSTRVYVNMCFLLVGTVGVVAAEFFHRRSLKNERKTNPAVCIIHK